MIGDRGWPLIAVVASGAMLGGCARPSSRPAVANTPAIDANRAPAAARYATVIQRSQSGTHARQVVREDSTASFALELAADGSARACRGWRYVFTNDGPTVHTDDRLREQAGFRGTFVERDGLIEIELRKDDAVCAPIGEYTLVRTRATAIRLGCVRAEPDGERLPLAALVCEWRDPPGERTAHAVDGVGPDGWIILGAAPGLRVKLAGAMPRMTSTQPATITVTVADAPLSDDAWTTAF